jgi:Flp pilus assembly protein TadG
MSSKTYSSRARRLASRFARETCGNLAIIFSMTLVVFMFAAGMAIDYVRASSGKTALQAAADATALATVVYASTAEKRGDKNIVPSAKDAGLKAWKANADLSFPVADPVINVSKAGAAWTAKVRFEVPVPTTIAGILGYDKIVIADEATASNGTSAGHNYMEFHIVVDNSASMGLGATQADMDKMHADPIIGCTFACHKNFSNPSVNTVDRAKTIGATLRIDVVESAMDKMLTTLAALPNQTKVKAALYGMQNTLEELVPMTGTISNLKNHNLEMAKATVSQGNTNFRVSMETLTGQAGKSEDGSSESKPQKFVFIVTDGVHDSPKSEPNAGYRTSVHYTGPMSPAFCQTIKDQGVLLGVLYVDYIVPFELPGAAKLVTPFDDQISPMLKACASDDMFFNAADPAGIDKAMADMLATALTKADKTRLTD